MEFSTKNNYVYECLKDEIIERRLRPGERIIISDVAKRYNVSPMPIREAINRLQQEGFIEVTPHVGARVTPFDLEKHKELMMIRVELEPLAMKLAVPCIDNELLAKLEDLIQQMEECVETNQNKKYGKLNMEFHLLIYNASPYKTIIDLVTSLWARAEFSRSAFEHIPERNRDSLAEHKEMIEAIKEKDAEKAALILRKQKEVSTSMHFRYLEQDLDDWRAEHLV